MSHWMLADSQTQTYGVKVQKILADYWEALRQLTTLNRQFDEVEDFENAKNNQRFRRKTEILTKRILLAKNALLWSTDHTTTKPLEARFLGE